MKRLLWEYLNKEKKPDLEVVEGLRSLALATEELLFSWDCFTW